MSNLGPFREGCSASAKSFQEMDVLLLALGTLSLITRVLR